MIVIEQLSPLFATALEITALRLVVPLIVLVMEPAMPCDTS